MDIKDLNKTQLILLTLLITFVVSIATGIVTVSLMQQVPKSVPQTINNVIERTIEKVSTPTPTPVVTTSPTDTNTPLLSTDGSPLVSIYSIPALQTQPQPQVSSTTQTSSTDITAPTTSTANTQSTPTSPTVTPATSTTTPTPKLLGQGIIISDVGLVLVDSTILSDADTYTVMLDKTDFNATVLKKFSNGFTILKIVKKQTVPDASSDTSSNTATTPTPATQ
jgi:hypothetical protein